MKTAPNTPPVGMETSWHLQTVGQDSMSGVRTMTKEYEPMSRSFKQEYHYLELMDGLTTTFRVPYIVDSDAKAGTITMEWIDETENPGGSDYNLYIPAVAELHSLEAPKDAYFAGQNKIVAPEEWVTFFSSRYENIFVKLGNPGDQERIQKVLDQLLGKTSGDIVHTHRDLKSDHFLHSNEELIIVDWEFAQPSDPSEEIGKWISQLVFCGLMEPSEGNLLSKNYLSAINAKEADVDRLTIGHAALAVLKMLEKFVAVRSMGQEARADHSYQTMHLLLDYYEGLNES